MTLPLAFFEGDWVVVAFLLVPLFGDVFWAVAFLGVGFFPDDFFAGAGLAAAVFGDVFGAIAFLGAVFFAEDLFVGAGLAAFRGSARLPAGVGFMDVLLGGAALGSSMGSAVGTSAVCAGGDASSVMLGTVSMISGSMIGGRAGADTGGGGWLDFRSANTLFAMTRPNATQCQLMM